MVKILPCHEIDDCGADTPAGERGKESFTPVTGGIKTRNRNW
jgi:hypothetical protein